MTDSSPRYRVRVDPDRCVGSTLCVHFAPDAFELNDERQAVTIEGVAQDDTVARSILEAAEQCPQCAIILEDAATGEQVFP